MLVRGGRVYLIDAFFCQVRPSAWRQSVDLANMLMMLALKSDSARVYEAALRRFTPEDTAEAFAATRGVTVPTQLRTLVMRDERSLAKEFAQLAPPRRRIPVQRWTIRRLTLTAVLLIASVSAVVATVRNLPSGGFVP